MVDAHACLYTFAYPCQPIKGGGIHPHPNPLPEGEGACWLMLMLVCTRLPTLVSPSRGEVFTLTPTLSLRERGPVGWYSYLAVHFYLPLSADQGGRYSPSPPYRGTGQAPTLSLRERGPVGWYSCLAVHFYLPLSAHQGRGDLPHTIALHPLDSRPVSGYGQAVRGNDELGMLGAVFGYQKLMGMRSRIRWVRAWTRASARSGDWDGATSGVHVHIWSSRAGKRPTWWTRPCS